jgi:hypothetical protein
MDLSIQIIQRLSDYLGGRTKLTELRDWLVAQEIGSAESMDASSKFLLDEIEGQYAEYSDGLISEDFLKLRLGVIVHSAPSTGANPQPIEVFQVPAEVDTTQQEIAELNSN